MSHPKGLPEKEVSSISWADETDDIEEPISKPKENNAWAKGNPWGKIVPPKPNETKDSTFNDFPEPKDQNQDFKKEERGRDERDDDRGSSQYGRKDGGYARDRSDYSPNKDNYKREERPRERDYPPREERGYHPREERNYPREERNYPRDERSFRDYSQQRREDNGRAKPPYRNERPPREPVPFPTEPPFTAFIGNLSFDVREDDLFGFFGNDCKVVNVRLLVNKETHKPKGFGYVEFEDSESLKKAISRNGEALLDRPLRIDVAEAKPEERGPGGWKSRSSDRPLKSFGSYPANSGFHRGNTEEQARERPKLDIKPRSDTSPKPPNEPDSAYQSSKFNPFGEAKPRDENFYLKKIEEDRKKRGEDVKNTDEGENPTSPPQTPSEKTENIKESPPLKFNHEKEGRGESSRRDSQKREDKNKRINNRPDNKPFLRGSKSQEKGSFRKEERKPGRDKFVRDEKRDDRDRVRTEKVKDHIETKQVDVTSTNLFSALGEDEE